MNIPLEELFKFVETAVDAGVQAYIKSTEPAKDRIKQAEARRYIKKYGFQPVMIDKWRNACLLTPMRGESDTQRKDGKLPNAAVWYSLAEIKKVICAIKLKQINNEYY